MNGFVDRAGRALLRVDLRSASGSIHASIVVWIDTGFTGDLVVPQSMIDQLTLPLTGTVSAVLADGSRTVLKTYECLIDWFGELKRLEVVANEGAHPLLGVGLLRERDLRVDYRLCAITLA
jgi:clan AA aspartic protease